MTSHGPTQKMSPGGREPLGGSQDETESPKPRWCQSLTSQVRYRVALDHERVRLLVLLLDYATEGLFSAFNWPPRRPQ